MHGGVALLIAMGLCTSTVGVAMIVRRASRRFLKATTVPLGTLGKVLTAPVSSVLRRRGALDCRGQSSSGLPRRLSIR
jgi:hypothetical protein